MYNLKALGVTKIHTNKNSHNIFFLEWLKCKKKSFNKEYIEDEESDEEIDETEEAIDTPRRMLKQEEAEVMEIMKNPARRKLLQDEF